MKQKVSSKKGQMTVEMVLLLVALMSTVYLARDVLVDDAEMVDQFIFGPWKTIAGMIESGVWKEKTQAIPEHPNQMGRLYTEEGD